MSGALNLEKQLRFYGAYHHNPVNIWIHITCVPIILWSAFLLGTNTPPLIKIPDQYQIPYLPPNLGLFACTAYCVLYVLLEPVAGTALAALLLLSTAWANHLTSTYGMAANYWALGAHIFSWVAQFVGHGKFEGRKPALLDNLFQAFFLAPLFVWLEVLFMAGYRPDLQQRIEGMVLEDVAKFRAEQQKGKGKANGKAINGHAKAS